MNKILTLLLTVALTGCANLGIGSISPEAVGRVATITQKETIIERVIEQTPIYYGRPHRGIWRNDPFFWPMMAPSYVRENSYYRYKITISPKETMMLDSQYNLEIGQCVTLWQIPNSRRSPRVEQNLNCSPAVNPSLKIR